MLVMGKDMTNLSNIDSTWGCSQIANRQIHAVGGNAHGFSPPFVNEKIIEACRRSSLFGLREFASQWRIVKPGSNLTPHVHKEAPRDWYAGWRSNLRSNTKPDLCESSFDLEKWRQTDRESNLHVLYTFQRRTRFRSLCEWDFCPEFRAKESKRTIKEVLGNQEYPDIYKLAIRTCLFSIPEGFESAEMDFDFISTLKIAEKLFHESPDIFKKSLDETCRIEAVDIESLNKFSEAKFFMEIFSLHAATHLHLERVGEVSYKGIVFNQCQDLYQFLMITELMADIDENIDPSAREVANRIPSLVNGPFPLSRDKSKFSLLHKVFVSDLSTVYSKEEGRREFHSTVSLMPNMRLSDQELDSLANEVGKRVIKNNGKEFFTFLSRWEPWREHLRTEPEYQEFFSQFEKEKSDRFKQLFSTCGAIASKDYLDGVKALGDEFKLKLDNYFRLAAESFYVTKRANYLLGNYGELCELNR